MVQMRTSRLAVLFAAALAVLASQLCCAHAASETRRSVADAAPRLALVIGNAHYAKLGTLANPGSDAQLIAERLRQTGFDVTAVADRDLKSLSQDVEEFAQKVKASGPSTVALLYYAGHGVE